MKNIITLLITLLISISSFAQQGINYKAILKDTNGNVLASTPMTVQFTIHKTNATGTIVYQEDHYYTTDANGLLILNIGTDTSPSVGVFADIDWSVGLHFLQTTITYSGNTINFDATRFMAVPYALHAANVSGLEKINQLGGPSHIKGWRLLGANPDNYVPIGYEAVDLSFASGNPVETGALGNNSIAMGVNTKAFGYTSMAVGYYSDASGDHSTALGNRTLASGINSTAMGNNTIASGNSSLAVGGFNIDVPSANFIVGNGATLNNRNNALVVFRNGSIIAPSLNAGLISEDKALITKEYADIYLGGSGLEQITQNGNTGWRLLGGEAGVADAYGSIGNNAIDLSFAASPGENYGATGSYSTALGRRTKATGRQSTAMGYLTRAYGDQSTAIGFFTNASGDYSTAIGMEVTANAHSETVIGRLNTIQVPTNTNGPGDTNWNPTDRLFVIANGYIDGVGAIYRSNAMTVLKNGKTGINTSNPESLFEIAHANVLPTPTNKTNALSITNSNSNKSFQLATHFNGSLTLYSEGNYLGYFNNSSGVYTVISDKRLKKDITPLDNGTLNKVMQLNPVSYLMKDQTDTKRNLGLISQEVQEIFPSITNYVKEQDLLTLSYTELIPILIKALQEQQAIIESQNTQISTQNTKIDIFETKMTTLSKRLENLEAINN